MSQQKQIVKHLDDAIGKIVLCTDGYHRRLRSYDERLGYYDVPMTTEHWRSLDGTYISQCRGMFIGGEIVESLPGKESTDE